MKFRTREEYHADLRAMRKNVFKNGRFIEDIVTDSDTRALIENESVTYDLLQDPQNDGILKAKSTLSGETVARWHTLMASAEDLMMYAKLKKLHFHKTAVCCAGVCTGWSTFNVLWSVTYEIDEKCGTDYHKRLQAWVRGVERKTYKVGAALTDAKGDRSKKASQQLSPDFNVHVKEIRSDGIVVSGAKTMIANAAAFHEIICIPGTAYKENEKEFAVAFVVPRDAEGLTLVQAEVSEGREGWDTMKYASAASYLIFEDCFIPKENVFMCEEWAFSGSVISRFTANYRAAIGACMSGNTDIMVGASALMARANGLSSNAFREKFVDMEMISNMVYGLGLGAMLAGEKHQSGAFYADPTLAHTNKYYVAKNYAEIRRICQDIGGGIAETGCLPNYKDCTDPVMGPKIMKYVQGNSDLSAETRARAARLCEWFGRGGGAMAFIHGGGSPDGARVVVRMNTPIEKYAQAASDIAGITEKIEDPAPKK
ncbi:4-hydroxybutyryl-CoA dehydratase [Synergistales bacterium]|nr:4-hydroxybutyryl-CoA dehydratase [Synergistales bacterium]